MPNKDTNIIMHLFNKGRATITVIGLVSFGFVGAALASIGADTPGRLMNDLQRDFGLQNHQAAGIIGNFQVETGNFNHQQEIRPTVEGSRGGYGMAQWTGPRRRQLEAFAVQRGLDVSSYEAQYGFLSHELNTEYRGVVRDLQNAGSVEESTRIFMEDFERPGVPHWDQRLAYAQNAANGEFGNAGMNPSRGGGAGGAGGDGMGGSTGTIDSISLSLMPWT